MTKPTNIPETSDFNDQAVNFNDFALPTAGETAGIVGDQVAQKTGKAARILALATALGLTGVANIACKDPAPEPGPVVVDPFAGLTPEQVTEKLHTLAEEYANTQGWSQGVASLVAGTADYYYYYPNIQAYNNKAPLIRLSYQLPVNDAIAKLEADAAARGTYNPKTEGVFQVTFSSLEGDNKNNAWFIPSTAIYDAKDQNKDKLVLEIGSFPPPISDFNTIGKNEGIKPTKEMQVYSQYGIKNATKVEERIIDETKNGKLKDIL